MTPRIASISKRIYNEDCLDSIYHNDNNIIDSYHIDR